MRIILLVILLFISGLVLGEDDKDYRKSFTSEELREKFGITEDIDYEFEQNQKRYENAKSRDIQILLQKMEENGYENGGEGEDADVGTDVDN